MRIRGKALQLWFGVVTVQSNLINWKSSGIKGVSFEL